VTTARSDDEVDVHSYVTKFASRLNDQVTEISATIRTALEEKIPELRHDAPMAELLAKGVEENVAMILHAVRHDIAAEKITMPAAAREYATRLAQHGAPAIVLVRAYRLGQRRLTELIFAELHAVDIEPTTRVAVIETITTVLFKYIDGVSQQAIAAYEVERERWLANEHTIRAIRVRDVLYDSRSVDVDAASTAIGYPLDLQHIALIVWYPGGQSVTDELPRLQRFLSDLAAAVDTSASPLLTAGDQTSEWAWLPFRSAPGDFVTKVRESARARPFAPNIAIGAIGSGVEGFRRSHRQAQRVQKAALSRSGEPPVIVSALDSGLMAPALLDTSTREVREWVGDVLGALASDTDDDAQLRETLRVFVHFGADYEAATQKLNVNFHDLKQRVERAVARRGRPVADRLEVEFALLVCHWYGADVLRPA
jgi:hypothetical protein